MLDNRRKFTPEFRADAVKLVIDTGRPISHVSAEIGVDGSSWAVGCNRPRS